MNKRCAEVALDLCHPYVGKKQRTTGTIQSDQSLLMVNILQTISTESKALKNELQHQRTQIQYQHEVLKKQQDQITQHQEQMKHQQYDMETLKKKNK